MTDEQQRLPDIPWEPQNPRRRADGHATWCPASLTCTCPDAEELMVRAVRERGYVVYKKRPVMRRGRVRLANGTVLEQTTVEDMISE